MSEHPPGWDLTGIYPAPESVEFVRDRLEASVPIDDMEVFFVERAIAAKDSDAADLATVVGEWIDRFDKALELAGEN